LNELNLELPPAPKPAGVYKPIVISSDMACVSGHGPAQANITVKSRQLSSSAEPEAVRPDEDEPLAL